MILSDGDQQAMFLIGTGSISHVLVGGIIHLTHIFNAEVRKISSIDVISAPCAIIGKPTPVD